MSEAKIRTRDGGDPQIPPPVKDEPKTGYSVSAVQDEEDFVVMSVQKEGKTFKFEIRLTIEPS